MGHRMWALLNARHAEYPVPNTTFAASLTHQLGTTPTTRRSQHGRGRLMRAGVLREGLP